MNAAAYDVIIVGAGIIGAACAARCARMGMHTMVIEGRSIGGGATAAAMGHIVVMDDSEAQFALTSYSRRLWQELRHDLPSEVEYEQCGTIWVAADDEEMAEVHRKQSYYTDRGVAVEVLDAKMLANLVPNLRTGLKGGLLVPDDVVLHPASAARFLLEEAVKSGATVQLRWEVSKIGNGRVLTKDGREFSACSIVNAAGVSSSGLMPELAIKERKGHLALTGRNPGFIRHQLVELGYLKSANSISSDSVAFNVQPRKSGQILIGSSRQYDAESREAEPEMLKRMLRRAHEYMPGLAELSTIRAWAGFRAATPDKLPLIGPWPGDSTLFLATGHEGLGITTSLGTARLLVDHLTGRQGAIPIEPYLPSRPAKLTGGRA
ncbi:MAG: NAD(P)/FAD-dependent oxidoreductase [Terriglobales bacterium]